MDQQQYQQFQQRVEQATPDTIIGVLGRFILDLNRRLQNLERDLDAIKDRINEV